MPNLTRKKKHKSKEKSCSNKIPKEKLSKKRKQSPIQFPGRIFYNLCNHYRYSL